MDNVPKGLRLHIGIFGRVNVGKSSFLNMMLDQDASIISDTPGTTTDVVERTMELLPVGPVVFHDTGGINDQSALSGMRIDKTYAIFNKADISVLIVEPNEWSVYEDQIVDQARKKSTPLIIVINKVDKVLPADEFVENLKKFSELVVSLSALDKTKRERYVTDFKEKLQKASVENFLNEPTLIGDLIPSGGIGVLIVPIDLQAPKGRLILPQVQTIRDTLDNDGAIVVVKEREYSHILNQLKTKPSIVVCDSQVVLKMTADTPTDIKCTTFSILFARYKGDLTLLAEGAARIDHLKSGDRILISEGCNHHAIEDDIGRVKIPRWLRQYTGCDLKIDVFAGRDYPENLTDYQLVILCGSCMLNRKETLGRIYKAKEAKVPITNYGVCISVTQGVAKRVLEPFPAAFNAYVDALNKGEDDANNK